MYFWIVEFLSVGIEFAVIEIIIHDKNNSIELLIFILGRNAIEQQF